MPQLVTINFDISGICIDACAISYQLVDRQWCIPFGKLCDFLEGIACLYMGMSSLTLVSYFNFSPNFKVQAIKIMLSPMR